MTAVIEEFLRVGIYFKISSSCNYPLLRVGVESPTLSIEKEFEMLPNPNYSSTEQKASMHLLERSLAHCSRSSTMTISTSSRLEDLSDDLLGSILLYCDFDSACNVIPEAAGTKTIAALQHVWKEIFDRHGFSSQDVIDNNSYSIIQACRERRRLLTNLMGRRTVRRRGIRHSMGISHRFFRFFPIVPDEAWILEEEEHYPILDTPPIFYECDSFVLTSTATSPELLFLNPFDGSLTVLHNCLEHCIQKENDDPTSKSDKTTANMEIDKKEEASLQTLLGTEDYFRFDIAPRFPNAAQSNNDQYDVVHAGIESKPIFDDSGIMLATMVAVGRSVRNLFNPTSMVCTELTSWTKTNKFYEQERIVRLPFHFECLELDANHNRVLVSVCENNSSEKKKQLKVYPMILKSAPVDSNNETKMRDELDADPHKYFPDPTMTITCQYPIAAVAMDSVTGKTLLVATNTRTLEVWNMPATTAMRIQIVSCAKCLKESIHQRLTQIIPAPIAHHSSHRRRRRVGYADCAEAHAASALYRQVTRLQGSNMESIHVAKHLSLDQAGFVTLQHSRTEGTSLLLWRDYQIVSLINLPLWSRRIPRIHYDGTRLIVFGQDHIGAIVLIYHCATFQTRTELSSLKMEDEDEEWDGDGSGGVYNLLRTKKFNGVQLANRIRHAALGGLDGYAMDTMHMTCNERFLIINTRTGNLLGSSPIPEGLLVIDLLDDTAKEQSKSTV